MEDVVEIKNGYQNESDQSSDQLRLHSIQSKAKEKQMARYPPLAQ